jgi:hypothetical protein
MDWMYPYLEPHGLIFKLDNEPLAQIPDDLVQQDHDYWTKKTSPMIGDWLNDDTSLKDVAAFVGRVFLRHDLEGFQGDPIFEKNNYTRFMLSKERLSIADLYAWRAEHSDDMVEKELMQREADFAFRQAWAMCPDSSEVILRYIQFLTDTSRTDDAILVARTCVEFAPHSNLVSDLLKNLEKYKKQSDDWASYQSQVSAMEKEVRTHPSDYTNIFRLAGCYLQMQQTDRAADLWKQTISRPEVPINVLRGAAQFFAQIDDFTSLETVLEKIAVARPNVPEPRYDLARVEMHLGKSEEAIKNLQMAIVLSDQRLKTNPKASNIRDYARTNTIDFNSITNSPQFQKLVGP